MSSINDPCSISSEGENKLDVMTATRFSNLMLKETLTLQVGYCWYDKLTIAAKRNIKRSEELFKGDGAHLNFE